MDPNVVALIIRLTFCRSFLFPIRENKISAQLRRGIISVAILYILAQSATIVYFYDRKWKLDGKAVLHFKIRWIFLILNSTVPIFLYYFASKIFRNRVLKNFRRLMAIIQCRKLDVKSSSILSMPISTFNVQAVKVHCNDWNLSPMPT